VLVVDDDPLSGTLQFHFAALLGCVATVESDAERAIERAVDSPFDLMLLDINMPGLDGFSALNRLREREAQTRRAALPVIAVTGYASAEDRLRCLTAGFADHVSKPVQVSALKAAIERVLGKVDAGGNASVTDADRLRATVGRLGTVRNDDHGFAPTVTESFALRSAQLIDSLRGAVRDRDTGRAERAAQALRSSAEFLGTTHLASMATELEQACTAADWRCAEERLAAIDHEHQAVLTLLFQASR
jgi:CheY-like chemotaxis protein